MLRVIRSAKGPSRPAGTTKRNNRIHTVEAGQTAQLPYYKRSGGASAVPKKVVQLPAPLLTKEGLGEVLWRHQRLSLLVSTLLVGLAISNTDGQPQPGDTRGCAAAGCHDEYAKLPVVHNPVETQTCDACHEPTPGSEGGAHKFTFVEEGGELCLQCHELDEGKVEHQPAAEGQCTVCHNPHASETAKLLTQPTIGELCGECHDELTEDMPFLHGPVAGGSCTACHNPHASDHPRMLSATGPDLCGKCHAEMLVRVKGEGNVHPPVKEDCTQCHNPHGGEQKMFLSSAPPEICLDCHDDISDLLDDATVTHDAVTTKRACLNCHDPHVGATSHLLPRPSMEICLSCHNKQLDSGAGKIQDIAGHLKENPDHHGPIRDLSCTDCHSPHGGEVFRLLNQEYPTEFYTSFSEETYALCFECHDVEMLEDEETDELTEFRNGQRNLHYLHVNREVKGRTCRACHEVHGSKKPKHIREAVSFGEWSIPINFQPTPTGGSCQPGCHRRYRYDRETAAVNFSTPKQVDTPAPPPTPEPTPETPSDD